MRSSSISVFLLNLVGNVSSAAVPRFEDHDPRSLSVRNVSVSGDILTRISTNSIAQITTEVPLPIESKTYQRPAGESHPSDDSLESDAYVTNSPTTNIDDTLETATRPGTSTPPVVSTFTVSTSKNTEPSLGGTLPPGLPPSWTYTPGPPASPSSTSREKDATSSTRTTTQSSSVMTTEHPGTTTPSTTAVTIGIPTTTTSEDCTPLEHGQIMTVFSFIWDATVTLTDTGNFTRTSDYDIIIPTYCDGGQTTSGTWVTGKPLTSTRTATLIDHSDTLQAPASSGGRSFTSVHNLPSAPTAGPTLVMTTVEGGFSTVTKGDPVAEAPRLPRPKETVTFTTRIARTRTVLQQTHAPQYVPSADVNRVGSAGGRNHNPPVQKSPPNFTITAQTDAVTINGQTVIVPASRRTTVTVDHGVFTIAPTEVVGQGHTIAIPNPVLPAPVSAHSQGNQPASALAVQPTNRAMAGGELLTAIGSTIMVLRSTTYTYGPGISETTMDVGEDKIRMDGSGITVHDRTLGGPNAAAIATTYEIVGGAVVSKLKPGVVAIDGQTITIRAEMETTTTVVGGEALTIGPQGVLHRSLTIAAASDAAVTTTFQPDGSWGSNFPEETGTGRDQGGKDSNGGDDGDDDEDIGTSGRPDLRILLTALGIATGVWLLI